MFYSLIPKVSIVVVLSALSCFSQVNSGQVREGFNTSAFPANDDGFTDPASLGFTINFFGNRRSSA